MQVSFHWRITILQKILTSFLSAVVSISLCLYALLRATQLWLVMFAVLYMVSYNTSSEQRT
jgi:hypothetical protein